MLHGEAGRVHHPRSPCSPLLNGEQDHDSGENHQVGVEEEEHAGVVKAPFALQTAGRLGHPPGGNQQSEDLPPGIVQILNVRKAGKAEAGGKCAE